MGCSLLGSSVHGILQAVDVKRRKKPVGPGDMKVTGEHKLWGGGGLRGSHVNSSSATSRAALDEEQPGGWGQAATSRAALDEEQPRGWGGPQRGWVAGQSRKPRPGLLSPRSLSKLACLRFWEHRGCEDKGTLDRNMQVHLSLRLLSEQQTGGATLCSCGSSFITAATQAGDRQSQDSLVSCQKRPRISAHCTYQGREKFLKDFGLRDRLWLYLKNSHM